MEYVHKDFVISADIISEEVRDYMIRHNLSMHIPYMDEREILILRTIRVIGFHIDAVCKDEDEDFIMLSLGDKLHPMFDGSLDGYKVDAIKFDNIIDLVHDIFQGNWGIEVKLIPSKTRRTEIWKPERVEFIKDDPIK